MAEFFEASEQKHPTRPYTEFLRVPTMSAGIYRLPKGGDDHQSPHAEDEVYYVMSGRARLRSGGRIEEVTPGSIAFVPAEEPHRYEDIEEDLELLVFFAPPESRG